jgi:DUF1680 family protein
MILLMTLTALATMTTGGCQKREISTMKEKFEPVVTFKAEPFNLRDVRLLDGPFKRAMDLDRAYLLSLDPDRLLHSFRLNAGLPSTAKPYGGWMTPGVTGCAEFVGHYLSACALMYASTGDERIKENANRVAAGFGECQEKLGTGYLHTKPDRFTNLGEAPLGLWYQIHKIMAGLMEVYVYCDNPRALEIARKLGDWAKTASDNFSDSRIQQMLGVEHGGINEAFANLYAFTGDRKYLQLALRFNHIEVIGSASNREDNLTGKHANTQIPKFVGAAREYELTGADSLKTASSFFWDTVARERSYVNGGNSRGEFFTPKEKLSEALAADTCETCNTYNMLKLTRHLFFWDPRAEYADFYERALYNHILASQDPASGMMCYFMPLGFGSKRYGTPENDFWCCYGTGIENHAKYGDSIYFHHGQAELFVNLFIASELHWRAAGITLRQETRYPFEGSTRLVFTCEKPVELRLNIRHPWWAVSDFEIQVNGVKQDVESQAGSYAVVTRTWKNGDTVDISMPFALRTEGFRDNPRRVAFMYGPLVLCAAAKENPEAPYPAAVAEAGRLFSALEPSPGKAGEFTASSQVLRLGQDAGDGRVTLEPLLTMRDDRKYIVYWNSFTPAQWQADKEERKAAQARLDARTVDRVLPGDPQSERDHTVQGENTGANEKERYRHSVEGGWFSWDMKVLPGQLQELCVKYWGGDVGRVFDILVDGRKLVTQKLENNKPGQVYEETYPLPPDLTQGKAKITVKFQAHPGKTAGGVFGCAILKKQE